MSMDEAIVGLRDTLAAIRAAGHYTTVDRDRLQRAVAAAKPWAEGSKPRRIGTMFWKQFIDTYNSALRQLTRGAADISHRTQGSGTMSMSVADLIAQAKAAGKTIQWTPDTAAVDTLLPMSGGSMADTFQQAENAAIGDVIDEVIGEVTDDVINGNSIPGPFDDGGYEPTFYEQHKTGIWIAGGAVVVLGVGGYLLQRRWG